MKLKLFIFKLVYIYTYIAYYIIYIILVLKSFKPNKVTWKFVQ